MSRNKPMSLFYKLLLTLIFILIIEIIIIYRSYKDSFTAEISNASIFSNNYIAVLYKSLNC